MLTAPNASCSPMPSQKSTSGLFVVPPSWRGLEQALLSRWPGEIMCPYSDFSCKLLEIMTNFIIATAMQCFTGVLTQLQCGYPL